VRICNPHVLYIGIYNPAITSFVAPANAGIRCRRISNPPEHDHGHSIVFACPCGRKPLRVSFVENIHFPRFQQDVELIYVKKLEKKAKKQTQSIVLILK